jgi:hypothetical protein
LGWRYGLRVYRSWQLDSPENSLGLCQAAFKVRQSALELCSAWTMGLGRGPGECPEGLPVERQANWRALVDIERDGIGQQCDRVVQLTGQHTHIGQRCCRAS